MTSKSVLSTAAGLLAAGLLATACSSSGGGTSASTSASPVPTSTVTQTATASPTSTATATQTVPAGGGGGGSSSVSTAPGSGGQTTGCAESQLRAQVDPTAVSASNGAKGVLIDFYNKSSSTCTLTGYPGAAIADSSGKQVKQATRTLRGPLGGLANGATQPPNVSLAPGAHAVALIEGQDTQEQGAAQAGCDASPYPRILVTPPNTRIAVPFDVSWPICESFQVHPVTVAKS